LYSFSRGKQNLRKAADTLSKFYVQIVYNPTKYSSFYTEHFKSVTGTIKLKDILWQEDVTLRVKAH
jgi:hypothetical protein